MQGQDLIDHIQNALGVDEEITADSTLFSSGVLDSVAMTQLIMFIEETAKINIRAEDVTLENFDTVSRITNYIQQQS